MNKSIVLLLTSLLASCASKPNVESLSSTQRAKLSSMEVLSEQATLPHTVLGRVRGFSCNRNSFESQSLSEEDAIEDVKVRAALLDADAVANVVCQASTGEDLVNNCSASVICLGDAIQYNK